MVGTFNQSVPEIPIDVGAPPKNTRGTKHLQKESDHFSVASQSSGESHGPWGFNALWPSGNLHQLVRLWMVHLSKSGDPGGFPYLS